MRPHPHRPSLPGGLPRSFLRAPARVLAALLFSPLVLSFAPAQAQPCVTTTNLQPQVGNIPENDIRCVYDAAGARTLAINQPPADAMGVIVYAYDGVSWTTIPRAGQLPPGSRRYNGVWTYDIARGEALLFGGNLEFATGTPTNTLFAFKNNAWEQRTWTGVNPPSDGAYTGAYDPIRQRTIYLAREPFPSLTYRTWEWTGGVGGHWEQGVEFGPVTPEDFVFDSVRNVGFLLASQSGQFGPEDDIWEYTPPAPGASASQGVWQRRPAILVGQPGPASIAPRLAYDPLRGRILRCFGRAYGSLYGYSSSIGVWDPVNRRWDPDSLLELSLPDAARRNAAGVTYDTGRDLLILTGGGRQDNPNQPGGGGIVRFYDTWEQRVGSPAIATASSGPVTVCAGSTTLFAIAPFGGPYDLHWFKNDQPIHGATTAFLSLPNSSDADEGSYHCTLSNACGTLKGPTSTLQVDPPITFTSPTFWPGCSTCPGTTASIIPPTLAASSLNGPALTLHLQKRTDLTWNDVQTIAPGGLFQLTNLQPAQAGDYRILVDGNACGSVIASTHRIEVGVQFDAQPQLQSISPCAPATFSVQARGTCIQSYQWYRNGAPLFDGGRVLGVTGPVLTISGSRFEDEGSYTCRVTDACGSRDSAEADLKLLSPVWVERPMNAAPPYPGSAEYWTSAFDENRKVMVLYGGNTQTGQNSNALWEYDGFNWTMRQPGYPFVTTNSGQFLFDGVLPPAPVASALVYNPDDRKVYLIGAYGTTYPLAISTWDGSSWARPYYGPVSGDTARTYAVFDAVNHRIVIVRSIGGSNNGELLIYDPATNVMTGPIPMQPSVQLGVHDSSLWYDRQRGAVIWYNNQSDFVLPTMWSLGAGNTWTQLTGNPPRLPYATPVVYDPVRFQALGIGGLAASSSYFTGTHAWPGLATKPWATIMPPANDWTQILPDGPPRNPAGTGLSPPNNWRPAFWQGMVFDTSRRAMIAAGRSIETAPFGYTWHTYERRYLDRVVFDRPITLETLPPGNIRRLTASPAGFGTLTYQWRRNNGPLASGPSPGGGSFSGSTTPVLTITGYTPGDDGNYTCTVTNACGSTTSNTAIIGCAADFNHVGGLSIQDVFDFLAAFFGNQPAADFNGVGGISVQDVFDFLAAWFGGC